MAAYLDTIVVGAGQAGLSASYCLTQQDRDHVVLEQSDGPGDAWRNHRWDSFTLNTPNWQSRLPGSDDAASDPDAFMSRQDIAEYLENYARNFRLPIRYRSRVSRIERDAQTGKYLVSIDGAEPLEARNVVVATGLYQKPKIPAFAADFPPAIQQLHSDAYRNPQQLVPGAVLVVGSAQSGAQIAEELYESGRKVYLAVGRAGRTPRRYRGKDANWWLDKLGHYDKPVTTLPSRKAKFAGKPHISGTRGGHTLNLHQFARDGVTLLGHLRGVRDGKIGLAPDLHESLAAADRFEAEFVKEIDAYIDKTGMIAPEEVLPAPGDGYLQPLITELDLDAAGVTSVIWATSYEFDFSFVTLPVFDADGYPIQTRGVTKYPGLFFVGLPWLHNAKSGLLYGVGDDAAHITKNILNADRSTPRGRPRSSAKKGMATRPGEMLRGWRGENAAARNAHGGSSFARFSGLLRGFAIRRSFGIAVLALVAAAAIEVPRLAVAAEAGGMQDVARTAAGLHVAMRVSFLHAGASEAEVERVLGSPTTTTILDSTGADRSLEYRDGSVRTEVTLPSGRVSEIALDLLPINSASLPMRARMVKPTMRRDGVLGLLGMPDVDETGTAAGLETERMLFRDANETTFSVILAGGLVVDVQPGKSGMPGIRSFSLPTAILDASSGSDLRIGQSPKQADSLLGPAVFLPVSSSLEGQPVLSETRFMPNGCGVVSLTFTGDVLTSFAVWSPETISRVLLSPAQPGCRAPANVGSWHFRDIALCPPLVCKAGSSRHRRRSAPSLALRSGFRIRTDIRSISPQDGEWTQT